MSEIITFPLPTGANYVIPDVGDENWGQNVTDFLVAIPSGVMPTSGTFSLTGDVSFGPTFGLVSQYFKTAATNPASAGFLRLSKTDLIEWRNNLGSGNLTLGINGSDQLTFAGTPVTVGGVTSIIGTANQIIASSPTGTVTLSTPQDIALSSSPTFAGLTLSSPLTVPNGGTGDSSFIAYSVVCGGTTSTGPLQSVADVGLSGQFLKSQGPGLLPTWANAAGTGTVTSGAAGRLAMYNTSTNTVGDFYLQNAKTIVLAMASQPTRSANLTLTIPNPGDAVSAASVVLSQGSQTLTGPYTFGTNQVTFPNGSALLPSICFSGDNTTGFDYAAGTIQVAVSAAQVFQFTTSENRSYQPLSMQSKKITSLADATAATDATAFGQVQYGFQPAVQGIKTTGFSTNSGSYVATGLAATITPTSSSNRIKISVNCRNLVNNNVNGTVFVTIFANGVDISPAANNGFASYIAGDGGNDQAPCSFTYIDSPSSTAAITYEVYIKGTPSLASMNNGGGTAVIILEELR